MIIVVVVVILQVVGQVVLMQCVRLKAVRDGVEIFAPNAADETLRLQEDKKRNGSHSCRVVNIFLKSHIRTAVFFHPLGIKSHFPNKRARAGAVLTSMSSFTCSCWSLSSPNASMIRPGHRDTPRNTECVLQSVETHSDKRQL